MPDADVSRDHLIQIRGVRYEGLERAVDSVPDDDASHLSFFADASGKEAQHISYRPFLQTLS